VYGGSSWILTNGGSSFYDALQIDLNRRMSSGLLFQLSYTWAKALANGAMSSTTASNQPTTLRDTSLDKAPSGNDIRHAIKINSLWEFPFGPGRRWGSNLHPVLGRIIGGWQVSGVSRVQSGSPFLLTSGRNVINTQEAGVVLNNITLSQLQDMVQIRKVTGSDGKGLVYWLPDAIIAKTWANLDKNAPYIGPQLTPNQLGYRIYLRNPWQYQLDLALMKKTRIRETASMDFRISFLNALNLTNFFVSNGPSSTSFGQTRSFYNDFSGSANPGSRVIEFQLRVSF
jgi:hypothetical protein